MKFRRAFLAFLVTACLLALVGLAPVSIRAQYSYQDKVLAIDSTNLWAYWGLDETGGTTAEDLTANNRDGTYNGVTLSAVSAADGAWADAPSFDGINDYVSLPLFDLTDISFTLAAWIRLDTIGATSKCVVATWASGTGTAAFLTISTAGNLVLAYGGSNITGTTVLSTGTWYHVAGTYNAVSDTSTIYVDGVSDGSSNVGPVVSGPTESNIGRLISGNSLFAGAIDEVAVWLSALSASDIAILADPAGLPTPTPTITFTPSATHSPTPTLEFGTHIILSSGQVGALYYKIDSGAVLLALLLLLQIGLLLALLALRMWRRG